jgi:ABC-type multidrug transport system fused ATPase/permease subunit
LSKAQLIKTVEHFDNKLDTQIGKKGVRLSGGQRQRLAIARMLLRNSKVVILDEATSALDFKTEHELFESIKDFLSDRTTIIITHRLSTIMNADKIYVINNGRIEEEGTHKELIHMQSVYYSLYILQKTKDQ